MDTQRGVGCGEERSDPCPQAGARAVIAQALDQNDCGCAVDQLWTRCGTFTPCRTDPE